MHSDVSLKHVVKSSQLFNLLPVLFSPYLTYVLVTQLLTHIPHYKKYFIYQFKNSKTKIFYQHEMSRLKLFFSALGVKTENNFFYEMENFYKS